MANPFKPAVRENLPIKIGLTGESGSGKTYSSLLLARGIVGPAGKIALIDTERGSSRAYGQAKDNGSAPVTDFDVLELDPPYTVARYIECIQAAEQNGYDIVIIDSISHEWEGKGGLQELHDQTEKKGLKDWQPITALHRDFTEAVVACPLHVICTVRAKKIHRQVKNEKTGKQEIVAEGIGPITKPNPNIEYEFDLNFYLQQDNRAAVRKDRTRMFSMQPEKLTVQHGERIREWLGEGTKSQGAVYDSQQIAEMLIELGYPKAQHYALISHGLGDRDPDAQETIDRVISQLSAQLNKRDNQ